MGDELKVKIPRASEEEIAVLPSGSTLGGIKKELRNMSQLVTGINLVVVLSLVAIIISVIGLFLDQMRFNSAFYKEYSQKMEAVNTTQKINEDLLKQIQEIVEQNKQDRNIILELQKQISNK